MELEKYKKIIELLNKELLNEKYINLSIHKKILIAEMIDKIKIVIKN